MTPPKPHRPSLTESPWFWVYLFSTAGLIALAVMGPKYQARQAQIERKAQGRQRAVQVQAGDSPDVPLSTPENTVVRLTPLYVLLGGLFVVSWIMVWRRRFRSPDPQTADAETDSKGVQPVKPA